MEEWSLKITVVQNGYLLEGQGQTDGEPILFVIEERDNDELYHHERLLWEIMEYFNFQGTKHDPERIQVTRKKGKT